MLAERGVDELRQLRGAAVPEICSNNVASIAAKADRSSSSASWNVRAASFVCTSASNGVELGVRQAAALRMTSVSTGMLSSSGCVADIGSYLMSVELVAAIAIEAVALAALLAAHGIRVDDLGDALVAAEELRHVGGEVDQHVPTPGTGRLVDADQHRLERRLRRARRARRDAE